MKTFIVIAAFFATIAGSPSNVRSSNGWGSPVPPTILVDLNAAAQAIGQGNANADLQLEEVASGDVNVPASIVSLSGAGAGLGSIETIDQVALVNQPAGSSSSIQNVTSHQEVIGVEGVVNTTISGANLALANISGASSAVGSGSIGELSTSLNQVSSKKQ